MGPPVPGDADPDDAVPGNAVPDDARDLERDRIALLRERAAARRRATVRRLLLTRRWETHGVSGPLAALALAVVGVFALGLALLVPRGVADRPRPRPLAAPTAAPGTAGGLLPEAVLLDVGAAGGVVSSEDLRPGAVLLVGHGCRADLCRVGALAVIRAARDSGLKTWLVGADPDGLVELAREDARGGGYARPLRDHTGRLLPPYAVPDATITLLVVDATGVVRRVLRRVSEDSQLLDAMTAAR